jgi:hypothetical protein
VKFSVQEKINIGKYATPFPCGSGIIFSRGGGGGKIRGERKKGKCEKQSEK